MAIRPTAEEILRGVQRSLREYVLPELKAPHAAAEVQYAITLLGMLAAEWDDAAQRLAEDNASLRALAGRLAEPLAARDPALASALRAAAADRDPDLRLTTLASANDRLRGLLARVAPAAVEPDGALAQDIRGELRAGVRRRPAGAV
jgi:hypothetical protein